MQKRSDSFGIVLTNIPLINVRLEFNKHHWLLAHPEFRKQFCRGGKVQPIQTPYLIWTGMPTGLLTLFLQRAFVGIEAYVVGAAYLEIGKREVNRLKQALERLRNPFGLGGRGVADNYYNRIPRLVDDKYALRASNPQLWESTVVLYSEVRNPVFHGYEIDSDSSTGVLSVFDHLADIYRWIDSWCDLDGIMPGASRALRPNPRGGTGA